MEERVSKLESQMGFVLDKLSSKRRKEAMPDSKELSDDDPTGQQNSVEVRSLVDIHDLPPEMLQMIMKQLDRKTLETCRTICRQWNLQATPIFANLSAINLCSFFNKRENGAYSLKYPKSITKGLIKNIKAKTPRKPDFKLFNSFCKKFRNQIRGIAVSAYAYNQYQTELITFLYRILTEFCPNLKDLYLYDIFNNESGTGRISKKLSQQNLLEFSNTLSLTTLKLDQFLPGNPNVLPSFELFLNKLICASKNLENLFIDVDFCPPDLSNQKVLKNLKLKGTSYSEIWEIQFRPQNKIEKLTVYAPKAKQLRPLIDKNKNQNFQSLRKLKIIASSDLDREISRASHFAYYMLKRSPVLDQLIICGDGEDEGAEYFEGQLRDLFPEGKRISHKKLSTLKIFGDMEDKTLFESIVNLKEFPNLSTLELSIGDSAVFEYNIFDVREEEKMKKWFEVLSTLKLAHLYLTINNGIWFSTITDIFSNTPSLFRGLETLRITCDENGVFRSDDLYSHPSAMASFQDALKKTSTLKQVEFIGFMMRVNTVLKLTEFVKKNNLPIKFD